MMMLIMDLEAEYDMTVEDDMLSQIKTVDDIVKYIEKRGRMSGGTLTGKARLPLS